MTCQRSPRRRQREAVQSLRWSPATAVVVFASTRDCGISCEPWQVMCPNTIFHASRDSAHAYLAARDDIDGQILDQDAAVERGGATSARCSAARYKQESQPGFPRHAYAHA